MAVELGLNLGTVSLKRTWLRYGTYLVGLGLFTVFILGSHQTLNLQVQYIDARGLDAHYLLRDRNHLPAHIQVRQAFKARNEHLQRVCQSLEGPEGPPPMDLAKFFYLKKPNVMMCMIPKVASTSLSSYIIKAHQQFRKKKHFNNIGFPQGNLTELLNETYKIMVVRHPMARLLSAYRYIFVKEVLSDAQHANMYSNLTHLLVTHYRGSHSWERDPLLTFPEFVRYLVNGTKEHITGSWEGMKDGEFAFHPNINSHWAPYWKVCSPCLPESQPTVIVKMDQDFKVQMDYVFKESGVKEFFAQNVPPSYPANLQWRNPGDSNGLERDFFGLLTKKEVEELFNVFQVDHKLFDYSIEPYLSYAK